MTGKEFSEYKDIKDLRAKAIEYYHKNLQGTFVENKKDAPVSPRPESSK